MSDNLNVVVVTPGLAPQMGGAAISEASLCQSLQRICDVTVLCGKDQYHKDFVARFGLDHIVLFTPFEILKAFLFKNHPLNKHFKAANVVHLNGHWKWENYFISLLCRRYQSPYFLHPRGMLWVNYRRVWLKKVFNFLIGNQIVKYAHRVIALSQYEVEQFDKYPLRKEKVQVIPNGIPKLDSIDDLVKKHPVSSIMSDHPFFLYIGRIEARKNLVFLLDAFDKYLKKGGTNNLFFVGPAEREYDVVVREKIRSLKLEGKAKILDPVYGDAKWPVIAKAEAVIYPSIGEPFGRVPFEAINVGTLPIVPKQSGSSEYLEEYLFDCLYEDSNVDSLVASMLIIDKRRFTPKLTQGLALAKNWLNETLDWENISHQVIKLYFQADKERSVH